MGNMRRNEARAIDRADVHAVIVVVRVRDAAALGKAQAPVKCIIDENSGTNIEPTCWLNLDLRSSAALLRLVEPEI